MAKGQQRSNKEKKKPKQDKKKLAPAPSPSRLDQRAEARLGRQEEITTLLYIALPAFGLLERVILFALPRFALP